METLEKKPSDCRKDCLCAKPDGHDRPCSRAGEQIKTDPPTAAVSEWPPLDDEGFPF